MARRFILIAIVDGSGRFFFFLVMYKSGSVSAMMIQVPTQNEVKIFPNVLPPHFFDPSPFLHCQINNLHRSIVRCNDHDIMEPFLPLWEQGSTLVGALH